MILIPAMAAMALTEPSQTKAKTQEDLLKIQKSRSVRGILTGMEPGGNDYGGGAHARAFVVAVVVSVAHLRAITPSLARANCSSSGRM